MKPFFALLFALHFTAGAIESKYIRCTRLLMANPNLEAGPTKAALQDLNKFRAESLVQFPFEPDDEVVRAKWTSGAPTQRRLTRRLSALLAEDLPLEDDVQSLNFMVGHVFEGTKNIMAEIHRRDEWIDGIKTLSGYFLRHEYVWMCPMRVAMGLVVTAAFGLAVAGSSPAALIMLPSRGALEIGLRTPRLFFYDRSPEQDIRRRVSQLMPGQWIYHSMNIEVTEYMVDSRHMPHLATFAPINFNARFLYPFVTMKWTTDKLAIRFIERPSKGPKLRMDSLLHYGPKGPVWTEVLRVTKPAVEETK